MLISVLTATIYFFISPLEEAQSELLARTTPTIYDVLIAFFGGAAGIIALSTRGRGGNVIPGVAIATALMPPLCTAGYGLATGQLNFFFGALYLFFINTVFIGLATALGVRMLRFHYHEFISPERAKRARNILMLIVIATTIPCGHYDVNIIRTSIFENGLRRFISSELEQPGDADPLLRDRCYDEGATRHSRRACDHGGEAEVSIGEYGALWSRWLSALSDRGSFG